MKPWKDYLIILIAYTVAGAAAFGVGKSVDHLNPILILAAADLAGTVVIFGFSCLFDNSSLYDPYWSVAPPLIATYWLLSGNSGAGQWVRAMVVMSLLVVWATRLTLNWAVRWLGLQHEDWRYVKVRKEQGRAYWLVSFFGIHLMPTVLVFLGCLTLIPALASPRHPFQTLDILAIFITAVAIFIEAWADFDVTHFLKDEGNRGRLLTSGAWRYSRHPNYFGEVLFWWGLYLFALAANPAYWWTVIGPFAITTLFVTISIPMMEKRLLANRLEYRAYRECTPTLLPWLRKK